MSECALSVLGFSCFVAASSRSHVHLAVRGFSRLFASSTVNESSLVLALGLAHSPTDGIPLLVADDTARCHEALDLCVVVSSSRYRSSDATVTRRPLPWPMTSSRPLCDQP